MSRPVSAFNPFPVVREAYTDVRNRLISIIKEQNRPELGLVDVPLWLFVHSCVPGSFSIPSLENGATGIGRRCQEMILPLLESGALDPAEYAAAIRDSIELDRFIGNWVARPPGNRVIAKKRALRLAGAGPGDSRIANI